MSYQRSKKTVLSTFFSAAYISGVKLWLDASDYATLFFNGSRITAWADKSGNGLNAVAAVSTDEPLYEATAFNGRPTITFPQTSGSDGLTIIGGVAIAANAGRSVVYVIKPLSGHLGSEFIGTDTAQMHDFGTYYYTNRLRVRDGGSSAYSPGNSVVYNLPHIITVTDDSSTNLNAWCDGAQIINNATRTFSWPMNIDFGIGWGHYILGGRQFWGSVSEIMICDHVLSTTERTKYERSLQAKWGF